MTSTAPTAELVSELSDDRLTLAGLFFESHAGLVTAVEGQLSAAGLAVAWFEVLMRLARTPGGELRMSDLAAQSQLSISGLTRAVDRLVDSGLVERAACPTDRRGSFARITESGRGLLSDILPGHLEGIESTRLQPLDAAERIQLEALLRKVRDHANPDATRATGC